MKGEGGKLDTYAKICVCDWGVSEKEWETKKPYAEHFLQQ